MIPCWLHHFNITATFSPTLYCLALKRHNLKVKGNKMANFPFKEQICFFFLVPKSRAQTKGFNFLEKRGFNERLISTSCSTFHLILEWRKSCFRLSVQLTHYCLPTDWCWFSKILGESFFESGWSIRSISIQTVCLMTQLWRLGSYASILGNKRCFVSKDWIRCPQIYDSADV